MKEGATTNAYVSMDSSLGSVVSGLAFEGLHTVWEGYGMWETAGDSDDEGRGEHSISRE